MQAYGYIGIYIRDTGIPVYTVYTSLVRTYKIGLTMILKVILYNCVYINYRLSLKPWMPIHENGFEWKLKPYMVINETSSKFLDRMKVLHYNRITITTTITTTTTTTMFVTRAYIAGNTAVSVPGCNVHVGASKHAL